ncbi:NUDIX hydrolase [Gracilimonas mengyeensis]|uniref:NUDIX domain-containing protein n=1 Tax=Gracilimonas mengyeensis TaxID=1302730 RepID=A0A521FJW2_9BACT|nr:CoA pyrophosphatase [Gracilimonas mengyeensis]SMO96507.1 NUDIX domain-containing protein [Gracilimonas mengyeensis]
MPTKEFQQFLKHRLQEPLPGRAAQEKMAPQPKNGTNPHRNYEPANDDFRDNSVLVPVVGWKEQLEVLFTLRTASINHGGQLSFPGGGKEGHETVEETALREAQEEIGLRPENVTIVGELTPLYVGHSDNMVTPVVAILHHEQRFTPNPNEVDEILSVPLADFHSGDRLITEEWKLRDIPYRVPFWDIHRVPLWGATAMMMSEFVEITRDFFVTRD